MQVYRLNNSSGKRFLIPQTGTKRGGYKSSNAPITHGNGILLSNGVSGNGLMKVTEKATSEPVNLAGVQNSLSKLTLGYGVSKPKKTYINFKL